MSTETKSPEKPYRLEGVEKEFLQVSLKSLVVRAEDYSFRDDDALTEGRLKDFVEDIKAQAGIHTPVLVVALGDGRYLVFDGHRRVTTLRLLARDGVDGFDEGMLVPAVVVVSDISERDRLAILASSNIQRKSLDAEGRQRLAHRLHCELYRYLESTAEKGGFPNVWKCFSAQAEGKWLEEKIPETREWWCDFRLRYTKQFAEAHGLNFENLSRILQAMGAFCDCQVLSNVVREIPDEEVIGEETFKTPDQIAIEKGLYCHCRLDGQPIPHWAAMVAWMTGREVEWCVPCGKDDPHAMPDSDRAVGSSSLKCPCLSDRSLSLVYWFGSQNHE